MSRARVRRRLRRHHLVGLVVAAAAALGALGGLAHTLAEAAPTSLPGNCNPTPGELPDICPSLPTDLVDNRNEPYLEVLSDNTRRFRFDAVLWNAGGAFELEGRSCSGGVCSDVIQRIWTGDGTPGGAQTTQSVPGRMLIEVGDGHGHYHYENAAQYEILVPGGPRYIARKVGFCMFDTYSDPNGPSPQAFYTGFGVSPCLLSGGNVTMGISRGWGDYYPAGIANQWVVVDGLEAGPYTVRAEVNPGREFIEANYANNVLDAPATIPGATAAGGSATTLPDTAVTIGLSGTVEGKTVKVIFKGSTRPDADDQLAFEILDGPDHGTLSTVEVTGNTSAQVIYTPDAGYTGTDSLSYRTTDSRGLESLVATVSVSVAEPPPPPPPAEPPAPQPPTGKLPEPGPTATPSTTFRRTSIVGTPRSETIRGTGAPETITARAGDDVIYARGGRDVIRAGRGGDRIFAGGGRDRVLAGKGDDTVRARDGKRDVIACGPGRDRVIADAIDRINASCEVVVLPA